MSHAKPSCPSCYEPGRAVSMRTVASLCAAAPQWSKAWFCESSKCGVVYFDEDGARIDKEQLRVPVFQKETSPNRPLCYCFGHSAADILAAQREDGGNSLITEIGAACREGLDRCEETNPQGRCCLGNARGLARIGAATDCCGGDA